MIKAQKARAGKELRQIKTDIEQVAVLENQLLSQGGKKLSTQVAVNSKVNIDEKDITSYAQILEKIQKSLDSTFAQIPPENLPMPSPVQDNKVQSPDKPVTPFKQDSPAPKQNKENAGVPSMSLLQGFIKQQQQQVTAKAQGATASIINEKQAFARREEERRRFLEEEKLTSMRQIMSY